MNDEQSYAGRVQTSDGPSHPPQHAQHQHGQDLPGPSAVQPATAPQAPVGPGPGWWQASDGNWYPPEQHPDAVRQAPPSQPGAATQWASPRSTTTVAPPADSERLIAGYGPTSFAALAGAVLIIIGAVLPWGSLHTGFGTISVSGTDGDGVITLIGGLAIAALLGVGRGRRWHALGAAVIGAIVGIIALYDMVNISSVDGGEVFAVNVSIGAGLWATLIGAIIVIASSTAVTTGRQ